MVDCSNAAFALPNRVLLPSGAQEWRVNRMEPARLKLWIILRNDLRYRA